MKMYKSMVWHQVYEWLSPKFDSAFLWYLESLWYIESDKLLSSVATSKLIHRNLMNKILQYFKLANESRDLCVRVLCDVTWLMQTGCIVRYSSWQFHLLCQWGHYVVSNIIREKCTGSDIIFILYFFVFSVWPEVNYCQFSHVKIVNLTHT